MQYITDINSIETGDVLLESNRSGSFLSKAIQWFQGNRWNHTGMFIWLWGELFVCEAEKRGICLTPFATYIKGKYDIKILKYHYPTKFDDALLKKMSQFMLSKCGNVPYDFLDLVVFQSIRYMAKKITGKEIWIGPKNENKAAKRFACSEWCAYVYHEFVGGFHNWPEMSPKDFDLSTEFTQFIFIKPNQKA